MIEVLDDVSWQADRSSYNYLYDFVEVVGSEFKNVYNPRKQSEISN